MKTQVLILLTILFALSSCKNTSTTPPPTPTPAKVEVINQENIVFKIYQMLARSPMNVNFSPIALKNFVSILYTEMNDNKKEKLKQLFGPLAPPEDNLIYGHANSVWSKEQKHSLSAKEINEWITKNTCGKFIDFYDKLDPKAKTIFLDSICFHGNFTIPFNKKNTILTHFQPSPYESITTKVMHHTDSYLYFEDEVSKWIELEFQNSPIVLMVALPKKRFELSKVDEKISSDYLGSVENGFKRKKVEVVIPPFQLNQKTSIKDMLDRVGADYSYSKSSFQKKSRFSKFNFSEISQVAAFNINELGMNISDETELPTNKKEDSGFNFIKKSFYADEPFLVLLKNSKTNEILLLGRVYKP